MKLRTPALATLLLATTVGAAAAADVGAVISTEKGDIHLELYADDAPVTVASFVNLAKRGYYDGLTFHRVIADFMIQGGDPKGTGSGGPGYNIEDEVPPNRLHDGPGVLSMAKTAAPHTGGSQFFITHKATPWLDGKHTVFGKVTQGQDVVDAIEKGDKMTKVVITGDPSALLAQQASRVAAWNAVLDAKTPEEKQAASKRDAELLAQAVGKRAEMQEARNAEADARQFAEALGFVQSQGLDPAKGTTTDSGVWVQVTKPGEGPKATTENEVTAHATGWLADGTKFWSSHDRDMPMTEHPVTRFVPGFTEGLQHVSAGGEAYFIIPGRLGYGPGGNPRAGIPGNATLVFKVELLQIH